MPDVQEHKTIAATALATDLGVFTAIAAAWTRDREGDVIQKGAFRDTIKAWRRSGKQMPLHWDHKGEPENVIGHIDPQSMTETDEGLLVKGQLDLENSDRAQEAWRLVKANTVGLSFGYLVPEGGSTKRADGGRDLSNLDVFEISITPAPMHPDTRILSTKAIEEQVQERVQQLVSGFEEKIDFILAQLDVKAVWSAAFINDLPDSSFLYIEPGGTKDSEGKTVPRSNRHFPVKDANGTVDLPHLRNALARIPQSNLSQAVKDRCTTAAQRLLDNAKSVPRVISADPDRKLEQAMLELATDGVSRRKSPPKVEEKPATQAPPEDRLKSEYRDLTLQLLRES